jgi:hypothetical protein
MSMESNTLISYRLRDHNVQKLIKKFSPYVSEEDNRYLEAKKTIFLE